MKKVLIGSVVAALAMTGIVAAQDAPFGREIKARQGIMVYRALQLGVLGGMAKGEVEYDAAKAQKAADALLAAATLDGSMLFPAGSGNSANPASTASDAIWADGSDIGAKAADLAAAATAMQAAAGDLESLKAAMGAVGGACGACHKAYRVQTN